MNEVTSRGPEPQPEPGDLQIFDTLPEGGLACRVCGALVAREGDYARIHWDWHEAANGA
jgi:hypothetical protein